MPRLKEPRTPARGAAAAAAPGSRPTATVDDAPPRRALGWAALAYALGVLVLGYPALAGRFLVNPMSDQYIGGYAFREFAAASLRAGHGFPLWNPYMFGGMPYVAAMHGDIFYPTFLLRMVLPTDVAMTWGFMLHVWLCGLFTYVLFRRLGIGFFGSLVGGFAYMMSGQIASLVSPGHDGKLYISALFPLTLLFLHRGIRDGRRWAWGALALTIGLAVLSPHPQLLQYLLLAAGAFAIFLAFGDLGEGKLDRRVALRRLGYAFGAVLIGGAIGAIQYLPVAEYVAWSPRAGGLSGYDRATSYSMPPEELINTYLPQFSGLLDAYWGRNGIHLHSEYLGVSVMLLALAGFAARKDDPGRRRLVWFWTGVLAVALIWALGGYTPIYHVIYAIVPGTKFFRAPSTIFFLVSFSIAFFAALGAERVVRDRVSQRYAIGWAIAAVVIAMLAMTGAFTNLGYSLAGGELSDLVADNATAVKLGALRSLLFVLLTVAIVIARGRGKLTARAAGWALTGVVALDLWSVLRNYWMFSAPASELYASDAIVDYLKRLPQPARVLAAELGPRQAVHDPYFNGDALMIHGIRDARGYHSNELGRYDVLGGKTEGWRAMYGSPRFWQLENIQYFLTNVADLPIEGATRVAGPVRNSAGSMAYLYKLPGDHPAAWVAPVIVKAPDEVVLATLSDPRLDDVRRAALFDTSASVTAKDSVRTLPTPLPITATFRRYEPGRISLDLDTPAPAGSALIVSENYYPGWSATVDGKPTPVGRADYVLMGIGLPAGARSVDLVFRSAPYERGKSITLLALALGALLTIGGVALERGRRAAA
ncbi:MAG TPA: hypothetical protein VNS52_20460 [Gemmatimonadaceae bacterium]|nr:hypothetical protein [Gemmatimonadaceae bacterium]